MKKQYVTMAELMRVLRPVKNISFMELCANFKREIDAELDSGAEHYEIGSFYTKNKQPYVIFR